MLERKPPVRVPGTAIFLTAIPQSAPTALLHSLKHYKVLHERNAVLTIESDPLPRVDPADRVRLEADFRDVLPHRAALRVHGNAERAAGACDRTQARMAIRRDVHHRSSCHAARSGPP